MIFSERTGVVPKKQIQMDDIDQKLRNRILNQFPFTHINYPEIVYTLDRLGKITPVDVSKNIKLLKDHMTACPWHEIYDIFEYHIKFFLEKSNTADNPEIMKDYLLRCEKFTNKMNQILEEEKSGYRIINGVVAPMTNPVEIESIEQSMLTAYPAVNTHLSKALDLYSDRQNPDYENSIKESISAVEAMCSIIVGKDTTLGKALNQLEKKGIIIHKSLEQAYNKIYGYTSNEKGIRHAGIDFTDAPAEDAKYMLVSCSAFVNYLTEKYEKAKGIDHEKDENGNGELDQ